MTHTKIKQQIAQQPIYKKWWFWLLCLIFLPFLCLFGIYKFVMAYQKTHHKRWLLAIVPLAFLTLVGFSGYADAITQPNHANKTQTSIKHSNRNKKNPKHSKSVTKPSKPASSHLPQLALADILPQLMSYTNEQSAGPTKNYYWENGSAKLTQFESLRAGDYHFEADTQGRSATARAVLTYAQYHSSKGSRQGKPLDPPFWPKDNPKIAIPFSLTGKTYHGYQYNRSHSIADSLLGKGSYTSQYNFTTGTRSQNVGANQDGGMRYAEELAENYWQKHPNTSQTISYQTTPLYNGDETIPRGSIVDMKSSDGKLDIEVIIINSAEGLQIDYQTIPSTTVSKNSEVPPATSEPLPPSTPAAVAPEAAEPIADTAYTTSGQWSIAAPGMVFISNSNKYYSKVTNPQNYQYMSQEEAEASGAQRATKGNQYARP